MHRKRVCALTSHARLTARHAAIRVPLQLPSLCVRLPLEAKEPADSLMLLGARDYGSVLLARPAAHIRPQHGRVGGA